MKKRKKKIWATIMTIECIYRFPFQRHYEPNSAYENYIDTEREEEYP